MGAVLTETQVATFQQNVGFANSSFNLISGHDVTAPGNDQPAVLMFSNLAEAPGNHDVTTSGNDQPAVLMFSNLTEAPGNHDVTAQSNDEPADLMSSTSNEATGGRNVTYNSEMYRLLSYPDTLGFSVTSHLARCGFYSENNTVCCQFCNLVLDRVTSDLVNEPHNCDKIGNIEIYADTTDYRYEANRILSFLKSNWPTIPQPTKSIFVGALDLARWGFYYTGNGDAARCNFCRLEVRGWECGDTAEAEHRRWNSHCPFISNRNVGNVKLGEENSTHNIQHDCAVAQASYLNGTSPRINPADLGIMKHTQAKHPEFSSKASRLVSFTSWPLSLPQRPEQLADAGFYYTGKGDRVICFQCGGGLKDWGRTDDPWVEHAVWFPRCTHLTLHKGHSYIQQVQHLKEQFNTTPPLPTINVRSDIVTPLDDQLVEPQSLFPTAPAVKKESENQTEVPRERQCKICLEKELGIVFLPCGHMAACVDCAPQLNKCPLCRGHLSAYVRAFLP